MKDDQATYVHPPTSRRQFLARLAAGTAALTVLNVGNVSHVLAANERAGVYGLGPQNGVDANKRLIIGILTLVLPRAIAVRTSDGSVQEISVIGDTDICRGACSLTPEDLKIGDRIDAACAVRPDDRYDGIWINANFHVGWGSVAGMDADTVTCAVVPEMYPTDGEHVLHVYPYTAVIVSSTISTGGTENLKAGDMVYYTGYSDTPDVLAHDIMAYRIFKMDALSADVASRVGAPR